MRTLLMYPLINTNKQRYLGSGHTILKWSTRKNVLLLKCFSTLLRYQRHCIDRKWDCMSKLNLSGTG